MKKYNVIDLFSGCGGLSEGFLQASRFNFLAHIEWEIPMVNTLRNNLINNWKYTESKAKERVIHFDIQHTDELINGNWSNELIDLYQKTNDYNLSKVGLNGIIKNQEIDFIIGGPPCQAYSLAGRAQDPNSMKNDYRNYLFESFVKIVDYYKPKAFVFENVPGILSAKPGNKLAIERIYEAFNKIGYQIKETKDMKNAILSSADFGVPQERKRVIIFGVKKENICMLDKFYSEMNGLKINTKPKTVKDAIYDLPKIIPLETSYKEKRGNVSHKIIGTDYISHHDPRYHNERDIKIFEDWVANNYNKKSNEEKKEYYKTFVGKTTNHNKYRSLEWDKPSPTIVSHLYKDGLMFIHPDKNQARSITIREAALLQSFPMKYEFIGSNAYCYKMIGNAVPVKFAKSIAKAIINIYDEIQEKENEK